MEINKVFKLILLASGLLAFFSPAKADDLQPIRLQLKWRNQFQFAGYYAAKIKGFYKDAGLNVSIKAGGYNISPIEEVKSGRADIGIYDPNIIFRKDGKKPLVALASIMQSSPYAIITLPDKHILKPADLIGKRVLSAGDQGWDIFRAVLHEEGINPELIKIIPRQKDSEEIIENKGDAVITYITTQPQRLRALGYQPIILKPVEYGIDFYGDVLFSTKEFAYKNPKVTDAFIEATRKGWEYAFAHQEEMVNYIYSLPGVKVYTKKEFLRYEAQELKKLIMPDVVEIGHMNLGRWQYMLDIYKDAGLVDKGINLKDFLYESPSHSTLMDWIKPAIYALILLGIVFLIITIINWQLRKQVKLRTIALEKEIESRKQAEMMANKSKEQIELILKSANIGLWEWDLRDHQKSFSGEWHQLIGLDPNTLSVDFDPFNLIHPDDSEMAQSIFKENMSGSRDATPTQFRIRKFNGDYIHVLSSSRVTMDNGLMVKISGAIINIDDIKRKEAEILKISEELMQSNNELKKFAYIVSHNLRGPLVNITSLFDLINQEEIDTENKIYLDKLGTSVHKLEFTLNDLIDIVSHQNISKGELTVIDFQQVINETIASIESQIRGVDADISTDFSIKTFWYSKQYFESILLNLFTNAIKYRSPERKLKIEVSTTEIPDYILLKVKDNGIGMDLKKNGQKIFGLYQRFNPQIEGKGIGLYIIKSHIESLKGKIEVESELNQGTTFSIYFPKSLNLS
ncbi:MAG: ABC transporter substrate-binding protein [Sphingobacteriales bacterium]|nr:ABC transporter substrate-binding protein [Sphingobacteriales bacterium]